MNNNEEWWEFSWDYMLKVPLNPPTASRHSRLSQVCTRPQAAALSRNINNSGVDYKNKPYRPGPHHPSTPRPGDTGQRQCSKVCTLWISGIDTACPVWGAHMSSSSQPSHPSWTPCTFLPWGSQPCYHGSAPSSSLPVRTRVSYNI